jgi:DNA ligase-1
MPLNSDQVYDAIYHISQTPGRLDKIQLLQRYLRDPLFERVIKYAYEPLKTFGISKFGSYTCGKDTFDERTWGLLNSMAVRMSESSDVYRELETLTPKSADLFERICRKDLRAGFTAESVNAAKPGTVNVFKCMLAHKFEEKRLKQPYYYIERKIDGNRALAWVSTALKEVRFFSRTGHPITSLDHFKPELLELAMGTDSPGVVFDCEAAGTEFNESSGQIRQQGGSAQGIKLHIFDVLEPDVFKGTPSPAYEARKKRLAKLFENAALYAPTLHNLLYVHEYKVIESIDAWAHYEQFRREGYEGAILKDPFALYELKRSYAWMKMKDIIDVDLQIVDIYEGEGKYKDMMGGFVCVDPSTGQETRVGGGWDDSQRSKYWEGWWATDPHGSMLKGKFIEVHAHEYTPEGKLRHPRFIRWRPDKDNEPA